MFKIFTESEETNGEHKMESKPSTTNRNGPMVRAARLLCTIKDLRDELNILRAVVSQQQHVHKAVHDGLFRGQARRSQTTSQIVSEIKDMDKYAERLNAAVSHGVVIRVSRTNGLGPRLMQLSACSRIKLRLDTRLSR